MFVVKDDNPAVKFSVSKVTAKDGEGNVIPDAQLETTVITSGESVVAVTLDDPPAEGKQVSGEISFGAPGLATVEVSVKHNDTPLKTRSASFTVTTGDVASVDGGDLTVEGLTEV